MRVLSILLGLSLATAAHATAVHIRVHDDHAKVSITDYPVIRCGGAADPKCEKTMTCVTTTIGGQCLPSDIIDKLPLSELPPPIQGDDTDDDSIDLDQFELCGPSGECEDADICVETIGGNYCIPPELVGDVPVMPPVQSNFAAESEDEEGEEFDPLEALSCDRPTGIKCPSGYSCVGIPGISTGCVRDSMFPNDDGGFPGIGELAATSAESEDEEGEEGGESESEDEERDASADVAPSRRIPQPGDENVTADMFPVLRCGRPTDPKCGRGYTCVETTAYNQCLPDWVIPQLPISDFKPPVQGGGRL